MSLSQKQLQQYELYSNDPWAFLRDCVFTRDQVDLVNPVKRFPSEWPYLEFYVEAWQEERLLAIPKSRRMTMSWTNIALYTWKALFNKNLDFAFVSKKEDDAAELVKRAEFIFDHIPEDKIPRALLPKKETRQSPPQLSFPETGSKIQGFPMGADQLRQFTFSGILGDECAFWEEARAFYSGAFPTIEGGGQMTLISSRSPGFFQRLVYDALDHDGPIEDLTAEKNYPLGDDSIIMWKNKKNRFCVLDIHYTANPRKRSTDFRETVKASMPIKDFMVEYERNWEVFTGRPVFDDYVKSVHESRGEEAHLGLPLLLGFDFGLTPACVVAQLREGRLHVLREYIGDNMGITRFGGEVYADLRVRYPEWSAYEKDILVYIDPAGLQKAQTDERTCAQELFKIGFRRIFPGALNWEERRKAVEHFLMFRNRAGAGLSLDPKTSPILARGFAGGYSYPEKYATIEPETIRPIKNNYSHPHDAFQYLCSGALSLKGLRAHPKAVPGGNVPSYSFSKNTKQETPAAASLKEYDFNNSGRN